MKNRFANLFAASFVLAAVLPFAASPASARTVIATKGSPGDRQDTDECPAGTYLPGFSGKAAVGVEQLRIVCAPLERSAGVGRPEGPVRGGNAGDAVTASCEPRTAVFGIYVLFTPGRQQVKRFTAYCRTATGQSQSPAVFTSPDNGGIDGTSDRQDCPDNEIATGLVINSGSQINGLGLICDRIAVAAAAPSGAGVAPVTAFQGGWRTETDQNGHYTLILQITNPGLDPMRNETFVTGQFINTDGETKYNGVLQGTIPRATRTLHYSYSQPAIKAGGQGNFVLSLDGNSFTGTGSDGKVPFNWNGRRAK